MENVEVIALTLLDLSAALDAVVVGTRTLIVYFKWFFFRDKFCDLILHNSIEFSY